MPSLKGSGALGALGAVRGFMSVVKEIDFDEVRDRAEQAPRTLVVAADQGRAEEAASRLFGDATRTGVELREWRDRDNLDGSHWDVIIVHDPDGAGLLDKVRKSVGTRAADHVFFLPKSQAGEDDPVEQLRAEVTNQVSELAPAFGRHYAAWRTAAVKAIIDETSKANAQFALVSNVPAVIPLLGGLVAASADLIVLTKNQVMMAYKIAAAHDRNLGDQMAIIRELTPVVGAGFLWRTIAREAASFIPLAAGTIPKVAIAFAGTIAAGRAVDYYYRFGKKPSKEQLKSFAVQAGETVKKLPLPGQSDGTDESSANGHALDQTQKIDVVS
jgi:uncharacterized protein (DUF697 family)